MLTSESSTINNFTNAHVQPFTFTIASLPPSSSGVLSDAKGTLIVNTPYPLLDSVVFFEAAPCCTPSTCTQAQIQEQQQIHNHTSFSYVSSDMHSQGPLSVSLAVVCPFVTANVNASKDIGATVAYALAAIIVVVAIAYGVRQVCTQSVIPMNLLPPLTITHSL